MNVDLLSAAAIGGAIACLIIGATLKFLLPGYLGEKGENLATKEDIEHITDKIEAVKTQYALFIEAAKVDNQLRVAASDARLQKAQQAFTLWRKLVNSTHSSHCAAVVLERQTWWEDNCLYLEPSAREAFSSAYAVANVHQTLLDIRSDAEAVKANFAKIKAASDVIVKSVSLPSLTREEQADLNASA